MLFKFLSKPGILKPFCAMNALDFLVKLRDLCKKIIIINGFKMHKRKQWYHKGYQSDQNSLKMITLLRKQICDIVIEVFVSALNKI